MCVTAIRQSPIRSSGKATAPELTSLHKVLLVTLDTGMSVLPIAQSKPQATQRDDHSTIRPGDNEYNINHVRSHAFVTKRVLISSCQSSSSNLAAIVSPPTAVTDRIFRKLERGRIFKSDHPISAPLLWSSDQYGHTFSTSLARLSSANHVVVLTVSVHYIKCRASQWRDRADGVSRQRI